MFIGGDFNGCVVFATPHVTQKTHQCNGENMVPSNKVVKTGITRQISALQRNANNWNLQVFDLFAQGIAVQAQ